MEPALPAFAYIAAEHRRVLRRCWQARRGHLAARAPVSGRKAVVGLAAAAGGRRRRPGPAQRLRRRLLGNLLRELERQGSGDLTEPEAVRRRVRGVVDEALRQDDAPPLSVQERRRVIDSLVADICGLGPVDHLFADPTVSDILVNGPDEVWVDRFGRLERTSVRFDDREHLLRLIGRLVASHGRHLDEASPHVDVRLADGSRLHALIPPLAAQPVMSIRRPRAVPFRLEELYACGTLSPAMGEFLQAAVACRLNLLIAGGAASGKTTFLNVLSGFIPPNERVITIEETAELRLEHPHVVSLEARLPNIEGRGEVTLRALVKNALRMRADRIIVGEVRGPEVFDMLQAMNVGHEGSLSTVHANSPEDALRRLENLVLIGGFDLPSRAIRELLAAALQVIVHTNRLPDGSRRITSIREVLTRDDRLATRELFRFEASPGGGGRHLATGRRPSFLPRLAAEGYALSAVFAGTDDKIAATPEAVEDPTARPAGASR